MPYSQWDEFELCCYFMRLSYDDSEYGPVESELYRRGILTE